MCEKKKLWLRGTQLQYHTKTLNIFLYMHQYHSLSLNSATFIFIFWGGERVGDTVPLGPPLGSANALCFNHWEPQQLTASQYIPADEAEVRTEADSRQK